MALPDVSRLGTLSNELWHALAARFRAIDLSAKQVRAISQLGHAMQVSASQPLRAFYLRKANTPASMAMRMFMFNDPVTEEEAKIVLADIPLAALTDAGLLRENSEGHFVSPFFFNILEDLFLFCDDLTHGDAAVMGAGETTIQLCRAAFPHRPVAKALDLGCGAGTCALLLAKRAMHVIGTDINPRAITLSKINARLNGLSHIDFREGDLFEPVKGEQFDLIASQPPFVPMPDGAKNAPYLYGGRRGDELAQRIFREIPPHLTRRGRAVVIVDWPIVDDEPLEVRVARAVNSKDHSILLLEAPPNNLSDYCIGYASHEHPELGEEYARKVCLRRGHFDELGIRELRLSINIIEPSLHPNRGWVSTLPVGPIGATALSSARIDKLIRARDLLHSAPSDLLSVTLRVPEGAIFSAERASPTQDTRATLVVRFPPDALIAPLGLDAGALGLVTLVQHSPTLRAAAEQYAVGCEISFEEGISQILPPIQSMLRAGLFEVQG